MTEYRTILPGAALALALLAVPQPAAGATIPMAGETFGVITEKPPALRARIDRRRLFCVVELPAASPTRAAHAGSLLKQTGFALFVDPFRNYYRNLVITVSFSGESVVHLVHAADHATRLHVRPAVSFAAAGEKVRATVELSLDELGLVPAAGDVWGFGSVAYLVDEKGAEQSVWGTAASWPMWSNGTSPSRPAGLLPVTLGTDADGCSLTRGNLAPEEHYAANRFTWTWLKAAGTGDGSLTIRRADASGREQVAGVFRFPCRAGEPAFINVPYPCPVGTAAISFEIRDPGGQALYSSRYPVHPDMPNRFPSLKAGFPADCLERTPADPRLKGDVQLTWQHGLRDFIMTPDGLARGYAYNVEDWWRYLAETHQALIVPYPSYWGRSELDAYAPAARAHGVALALMPTAAAARDVPAPAGREHQLFYADPKAQEAYLAAMKKALADHGDIVRYIYFGDEFEDALVTTAIYLWQQQKDAYPFIRAVNEEIKRVYGFGRYGIPEKSNHRFQFEPIEPFHWIALRRWVADFTATFAARVKEEARKIKPDILVVSPDPKAGNRPQYYERWRGLFDLATFQAYLKPVPEEEMFAGYGVKLIRDLSGVGHVWPCLHMESLGALYSPEEVREVLSQTFIAGSTGMHTWPIPGRGSVPIDRIDAPARQAMFEQFGELVGSGLRAKQAAAPEAALLYSNDSCASHADEYGIPQPPKAYRYMSDGCAVDFRWIGDLGIELGHDRPDNYRVLFVPVAHIIRKSVTEKVLAAVRGGLNLVVLQPESFSFHLDGTGTDALASAMRAGATLEPRATPAGIFVTPDPSCAIGKDLRGGRLPVMGDDCRYRFTDLSPYRKAYTFGKIPRGAEVVLRYPDGAPAAIRARVGRGTVLWTGFNPLLVPYAPEWTEFFRAVLRDLGIALDRPAWRLRLPLEYRSLSEDVVYFTGNQCGFECSIPQATRSVYLPGSYRYTVAPDLVADTAAAETAISFAAGKLTDRLRPAAKAYVTFGKTEPFAVEFDLSTACTVQRVDLYCAEHIPVVTLSAGIDGKAYQAVSRAEESGPVGGVRRVRLELPAPLAQSRFLRLQFGQRPPGGKLTLAEVDIIGPAGTRH